MGMFPFSSVLSAPLLKTGLILVGSGSVMRVPRCLPLFDRRRRTSRASSQQVWLRRLWTLAAVGLAIGIGFLPTSISASSASNRPLSLAS